MARKTGLNLKYNGHDSRARQQYFRHVTGHSDLDKELAWKTLKDNRAFRRMVGTQMWIELSDITSLCNLMIVKQGKSAVEAVRYLKENEWLI